MLSGTLHSENGIRPGREGRAWHLSVLESPYSGWAR